VNQTLRHNGTTWVANNNLYNTGSNVAIGHTTTNGRLDVNGRIAVGREGIVGTYDQTKVQGIWSIGPNNNIYPVPNTLGDQTGLAYAHENSGFGISGWGHQVLYTKDGVPNAIVALGTGNAWFNGNVGVNTNSPTQRLHVQGNGRFSALSGTGTRMVVANASGVLGTQALPTGDTDWVEVGNDVYHSNGVVSINTSLTNANYKLYVDRVAGDVGAGKATIYAYRAGAAGSTNGGTGWSSLGIDAAIRGHSNWGNSYSAGVAGYSFLDYNNSAGVIGGHVNGSIRGALAFKDSDGTFGLYSSNSAKLSGLSGSNTRMVVTDAAGVLSAQPLPSAVSDSDWLYNNGHIYNANTGNVGVHVDTPQYYLHVRANDAVSQATVEIENIATGTGADATLYFTNNYVDNTDYAMGINSSMNANFQICEDDWVGNNIRFAIERGSGNIGIATNSPTSKLHIVGAMTVSGTKSFLIDHPEDPANKTLRHFSIESNEAMVIYRGKVKLDANGEATVSLPSYFDELTKAEEATVTLTPIGRQPFLTSYEWQPGFTRFMVFGDPNGDVSYQVMADRDDPTANAVRQPVEMEKGPGYIGKGTYLFPEAFGQPASKGTNVESHPKE